MPGRMGNGRSTASNLKIIQIDQENNILYISGAVPGARNGLVLISGEGELKTAQPVVEKIEEAKEEEKTKIAEPVVEVVKNEAKKIKEETKII